MDLIEEISPPWVGQAGWFMSRRGHRGQIRRPRRDLDVMTRADAEGMRTTVLRTLAAAAVALGLVSGCTGAPSARPTQATRPTREAQSTRPTQGTRPTREAQSAAGLRDVRPCPGNAGFSCGSLS